MDLVYHFIGGFVIALIIVWLTRVKPLWALTDKTFIIAGFSGLAAGGFKELVIDHFIRGTAMDLADVTLTWSGSFALIFLLLIIRTYKTEIQRAIDLSRITIKVNLVSLYKFIRWWKRRKKKEEKP
jgi:hypothetical protein